MSEANQLHNHVQVQRLAQLRLDHAKLASDIIEDARLESSCDTIWKALTRRRTVEQRPYHQVHGVMEAPSRSERILSCHLVQTPRVVPQAPSKVVVSDVVRPIQRAAFHVNVLMTHQGNRERAADVVGSE